jgi:hypothetical protein
MLSIAVYAGLRGGASSRGEPLASSDAAPSPSAVPLSSGTAPVVASAPSSTSADRDAVTREVTRAVAAQKAAIAAKCWAPVDAAKASYVLNFTFGPDGHQLGRGISEVSTGERVSGRLVARDPGSAARGDPYACLSATLTPVSIAPPGTTVYVEVPLDMP